MAKIRKNHEGPPMKESPSLNIFSVGYRLNLVYCLQILIQCTKISLKSKNIQNYDMTEIRQITWAPFEKITKL